MGTDIHGWVEVKVNNKWIAYKELSDDSRNYKRFGLLANVRCFDEPDNREPLGLPADVSETVKLHSDYEDGHSHSYMTVKEAVDIFIRTSDSFCNYSLLQDDHIFDFNNEDTRFVFWFDS